MSIYYDEHIVPIIRKTPEYDELRALLKNKPRAFLHIELKDLNRIKPIIATNFNKVIYHSFLCDVVYPDEYVGVFLYGEIKNFYILDMSLGQ